ncbi:MAG: hypothetical protein ABI193_01345, partial [Minicystis sp.]
MSAADDLEARGDRRLSTRARPWWPAGALAAALASFAALVALTPPVAAGQDFTCGFGTSFFAKAQDATSWCWAASGEMAVRTAWNTITPTPQPSQCAQATAVTGSNCCASTVPIAACNVTGWPNLSSYGVSSVRYNEGTARPDIFFGAAVTDTSAHTLTGQLCGAKKHPVVFTWKECGGGSHMMVVKGISVDATTSHRKWVSYVDP